MRKYLSLLMMALLTAVSASAFTVDDLIYEVNADGETVTLTLWHSVNTYGPGMQKVPATVEYNGKTYTVSDIGAQAFKECSELKYINIVGNPVIHSDAFLGCANLHTVTGLNVTKIGSSAFKNCTALVNVNLPAATDIDYYVFMGCTSLTSYELPEGLTLVPMGLFWGCTSLASVTLPSTVTEISAYAFAQTALTMGSINIPDSVTRIRSNVFSNTLGINTAGNYVDGVLYVDHHAIACPSGQAQEECILRPGTLTIADDAFYKNSVVKTVVLPYGLRNIGYHAFDESVISSINIPASVETIGNNAFASCVALKTVKAENDEPDFITLGTTAFSGLPTSAALYVPKSRSESYQASMQWQMYFSNIAESDAIYDFYALNVDGLKIYYKINADNTSVTMMPKDDSSYFAYSGDVVIPDTVTYNGKTYNVTAIDPLTFANRDELVSLVIGNNVTAIEEGAFQESPSLKSVTIGHGVTGIAQKAFYNCPALETVVMGNSVINILESAFSDCTALKSVKFGSSITDIGRLAFYRCTSLTEVVLPYYVNEIHRQAFSYCSALETVVISSDYPTIYPYAFAECMALKKVVLERPDPAGYRLGYDVMEDTETRFDGTPLANATLYVPRSAAEAFRAAAPWSGFGAVEEMAYDFRKVANCFDDDIPGACGFYYSINPDGTSVTQVPRDQAENTYQGEIYIGTTISNDGQQYDVTAIGENAFRSGNMKEVLLASSITSIGESAFRDCKRLKMVNTLGGLNFTHLGDFAFDGCENLLHAGLGKTAITTTGNYTFRGCTSLTSSGAQLPETVTTIGESAFEKCSVLTSFAIPDAVTEIGNWAFKDCSKLTEITIGDNVKSIGFMPFDNTAYYNNDANWTDGMLYLNKQTPYLVATNKDLPESCTVKEGTAVMACGTFMSKPLKQVTLPESLTVIPTQAFQNCNNLATANLPSTLTTIERDAFSTCMALTSVKLPESLVSLGDYAYRFCTRLASVDIPGSVTEIGKQAFGQCYKLTSVHVDNPNPAAITLGDDVFNGLDTDACDLFVPEGSVDAYALAPQWADFAPGIYEYSPLPTGDVNGDGLVSPADIALVIDVLLGNASVDAADVNGDGNVTPADIAAVIDIILHQ